MKQYLNPFSACFILALALGNELAVAQLFVHDGELGKTATWMIRVADLLFVAGLVMSPWIWSFATDRAGGAFRSAPNVMATLVGVIAFLLFALTTELGFQAYDVIRERSDPEPVLVRSVPPGQLRNPGVTVRERRLDGDNVIYDYAYTLDERSARVTPASPNTRTGNELVVFGCSFVFGTGVNDDETLPNSIARRVSGWRVTNFGVAGSGPAHMLRAIESGNVAGDFRDCQTHVVFVYIPDHVRRVIGGMRTSTRFGDDFPLYAISADGTLEYRGTMTTGRPWLHPFYRLMNHEPMMKAFDIDLPIRLTDRHLDLTARVIAASRDRWVDALGDSKFTVVIYPEPLWAEIPAHEIVGLLEANGIEVLDYSSRFEGEHQMWIPGDYHPTAEAHDRVAAWIVQDLNLSVHATTD